VLFFSHQLDHDKQVLVPQTDQTTRNFLTNKTNDCLAQLF
jgi:hypothetical protein